jgi:starvation-inducible DNA-binding protein
MKQELIAALNRMMAISYHMYYRAHAAHWNVVGSNFPQYHDFFGDIYEQVFEPIDDYAENIRKLGGFPPMNFVELLTMFDGVVGAFSSTDAMDMMANIKSINDTLITALREGITVADESDEPAISNFLQDRLSAHQKLDWKLTSTLLYNQ